MPFFILFPPWFFPTSAVAIVGLRLEKRRQRVKELGNLAHVGNAQAIRALAAFCLDPDFTDIATEQLVRSSPNVIPLLLPNLSDRKVRVRGGAAYALGRIGPDAINAIPGLTGTLRDRDVRVQITAADSLQRVDPGTRKTISYLVPWLAHVDPSIRRGAAEVLSRARPIADDLGSSLNDLLRDPDELTRVTAARALYKIGYPSQAALRCLIEALRGKDRKACIDAARTVAEIGSPAAEAVPALLEAALDPARSSPDHLLVEALAAIDVKAIPALIVNLGHPAWKLRATVAWALGRIGSRAVEGVPALIRALQDQDWRVRAAAAWALGRIGPGAETSVPALINTLQDEYHAGSPRGGQAASNALKRLTGKDLGPPEWPTSTEIEEALSAWQAWWQSQPQSGSKDEARER